jgi:glycerol-3-phosphate acyltransferase PlsX
MRIAIDVMGGDHGCGLVIDGVKQALAGDCQATELHLVGREEEIHAALKRAELHDSRLKIVHASEVLTMEDKPVVALRKKKDSSILRAVELVKDGKADAVISQGNTGGIVAAAHIRLRPLEGVERPAIACIMPRIEGEWVLLDGGANPEATAVQLAQSAVMGSTYYRHMLGVLKPRVGIISNGTEEIKGTEITREALKLCQQLDLNFVGFIEGTNLYDGSIEVAVADGFVGNIVLKTSESLGKAVQHILKSELTSNPVRKLGALIAQRGLRSLKRRMNPDSYGGAQVLGLNGNVIKVHGSAKAGVIANAIRQTATAFATRLNEHIQADIARANEKLAAAASFVPANA